MTFIDSASERRFTRGGAELSYYEWNSSGHNALPTLLFVHASGFHARCWDQVIRQFESHHVIAVDLRGHGRSAKTNITDWRVFSDDLSHLIEQRDLSNLVGIGHSLGGHAVTVTAASHLDRFRRLILIDPAIISPDDYKRPSSGSSYDSPEDHPAAKRRSHFESPGAMLERFKDRQPYTLFTQEALQDYCNYGLLQRDDGDGYDLACSPITEASVYMTSHSNPGIHDSIATINLPVLLVRAQDPTPDNPIQAYSASPTWPELAGAFKNIRYLHYTKHTHFLPMQIPSEMARVIHEELAK